MNTHALKLLSASLLAAAVAFPAAPAFAQMQGHTMPMPPAKPAPKKSAPASAAKKPVAKPAPAAKPAAGSAGSMQGMDHSKMPGMKQAPATAPRKPAAKAVARPAAKAADPMQGMDHSNMPGMQKVATPAARKPAAKPAAAADSMQGMDHSKMPGMQKIPAPAARKPAAKSAAATGSMQGMDHSNMPGMQTPATLAATGQTAAEGMDHSKMEGMDPSKMEGMDHSKMEGMDHSKMEGMDHSKMEGMDPSKMEGMDHGSMAQADPDLPADAAPLTPIPQLTDADRAAAFPSDAHGHAVHDQRRTSFWLVDRLEWQDTKGGSLAWDGLAWIGGDLNRVWLRTEGEASSGEVESANAEVLYGRAISPWWDAVAGVRQEFGRGPSRNYAAFGFQGLAPYKFEAEITAFIGAGGRGGVTLEAEYDTLITNRLILQWQGETTVYAKDDSAIGVGSGLSTIEAGARLRYEFSRRFAPYVGVEFERAFGGTADLRREDGESTRDTRLVAGIRFWF